MKKVFTFITYSLSVLLILGGVYILPGNTYAASNPSTANSGDPIKIDLSKIDQGPDAKAVADSQATRPKPGGATAWDSSSCGLNFGYTGVTFSISSLLGCALESLFSVILKLTATLLALSGLILDFVIQKTVVEMAKYISGISSINVVWRTIRDLGNLSFIFILLYQGIQMILGIASKDYKKTISMIFLAAIVVNFSLFFTKAIIDASNIITIGFYNSISEAGGGVTTVLGQPANLGFSGAFMKPLGVTGLLGTDAFNAAVAQPTKDAQTASIYMVYIGGTLFIIVTMFSFLVISLLFIIRFVTFIILLMMSPIAFLSMAIPGLESLERTYWETLWGQVLFGPIYMLLSWVILNLMADKGFLLSGSTASGVTPSLGSALANPNPDTISVIINFIILISLMMFAITTAKSVSKKGGISTHSYMKKATGYVGTAAFGGASYLGSRTIGRAGAALADNKELKTSAAQGNVFAKIGLNAGNKLGSSSFDVRNSKTFNRVVGKDGADIDLGKARGAGGYNKWLSTKEADQKKKDIAKLNQYKLSENQIEDNKKKLEIYEAKLEKANKENLTAYESVPQVEANEKKYHLEDLDKNIAALKKSTGVDVIEQNANTLVAQLKADTEKKKKVSQEIVAIREMINKAGNNKQAIQNLNTRLDAKIKEEDIIRLDNEKNNSELKELTDKKTEIFSDTNLGKLISQRKTDEKIWISENLERLIANAGGRGDRDVNGNIQKAIKKNLDLASEEHEKLIAGSGGRGDIESQLKINEKAYKERVASSWTGKISDVLVSSDYTRKRARAISKSKSKKEERAELLEKAEKLRQEEEKDKKDSDEKLTKDSLLDTVKSINNPPTS